MGDLIPNAACLSAGVAGVILAAGRSSRMGRNKMLLPIGGTSILEHCIIGMSSVCSQIIVVLGAGSQLFDDFRRNHSQVEFVYNENPDRGMLSSVLTGLLAVREPRVLILPGDCPFVPAWVYRAMLGTGCARVVPVCCGRRGHPVLLNGLSKTALAGGSYASLSDFLERNGAEPVNFDECAINMDIDDEAAYQQACEYYDQHHHRAGG